MNAQGSSRTVLFDVGGVLVDAHPDPALIARMFGDESAASRRSSTRRCGRIAASTTPAWAIANSGIGSLGTADSLNPPTHC